MKHTALLLPALAIAVLGSGCVAPQGTQRGSNTVAPPVIYEAPIPDGYYTGTNHGFESRSLLDPHGRKFRIGRIVAFLVDVTPSQQAVRARSEDPGKPIPLDNAKTAIEKRMADFVLYMALREQAENSHAFGALGGTKGSPLETSSKEYFKAKTRVDELKQKTSELKDEKAIRLLSDYRSRPDSMTFDLAYLYPTVFSTDSDAFPIDIAVCCAHSRFGTHRSRPIYEGFVIGLPEHASLGGWDFQKPGVVFPAVEAFADPLEAVAAALFKLTPEQIEGLEPSNPNDHDWLE